MGNQQVLLPNGLVYYCVLAGTIIFPKNVGHSHQTHCFTYSFRDTSISIRGGFHGVGGGGATIYFTLPIRGQTSLCYT